MLVHGLCNMSALFEQKKIKLWNQQHIVENKTDILKHDLKMQQIYLLPKYVKWISWGVVKCVRVRKHKLFKCLYAHYRGANKSLTRPRRKQGTATEDFDFHKSYL